jgi:murein DD-endopeptidase MepM/ murein hydrolase activator NlpD
MTHRMLTPWIADARSRVGARLEGMRPLPGKGSCGKASLALLLLMILAVVPARASASPVGKPATSTWSIEVQPVRLVNGSPVFFRVAPGVRVRSLTGQWLKREVLFSADARNKTWYGLAGISLETAPGVYSLQLTGVTPGGEEISFEKKITVRHATYPSIAVTVAKKFTEPDTRQVKEIDQGKTIKQEAFSKVTGERQWSGDFRAPVEARISDVFGTQRKFNGKVLSTHQGLDFAVPTGTSVSALNRGTVILARSLYFEGNCVVIDHGLGLLTLYLHLSQFKVKEGDRVESGQVIGLSGGTGRATGPHLHLAVRWQGVYLDPASLLQLDLPQS